MDHLNNRKQQVLINGPHSDWLPVQSCVPQGSILGPLLFILYNNNLLTVLSAGTGIVWTDMQVFQPLQKMLTNTLVSCVFQMSGSKNYICSILSLFAQWPFCFLKWFPFTPIWIHNNNISDQIRTYLSDVNGKKELDLMCMYFLICF